MFDKIFSYIFNIKNNKKFINMWNIVNKINSLEKKFSNLDNKSIKNNTFLYKNDLISGKKHIDDILPYAFANAKEAIKRILGINLFNVQLLGAIVLHYGYIAEMKTGEGKTITSILPAYLNSLLGKGVHIVTINEYLAQRDAINNSKLFDFLGLTTGLNLPNMSLKYKKEAYNCDITYSTNNEYVFDYLRDNMVLSCNDKVQKNELNYAIIDEIDFVLIDEARTPLIISGPIENNNYIYNKINNLINQLNYYGNENIKSDFIIDEKSRNIYLTDIGLINVEFLLVKFNFIKNKEFVYTTKNIKLIHYIITALKANYLFKKNIDYLVKNNEILIIDEFTGRILYNRRWPDGLHQAIEAKENVVIKSENQTLASITFQNYFKLYYKLSGMTGTAVSEASEFYSIYKLNIISIPTNKPIIRNDLSDVIFFSEKDKIKAIINDIKLRNKKGQPVLVGTTSVLKSEIISLELKKNNIKHNVLNAKHHMHEADIIAKAGELGSVTIATNMAGRGTDIILGGNYINKILNIKNKNSKKIQYIKNKWNKDHNLIIKLGGLHIIGTERNESRRIDNQLCGRAGRQGDPGSSRFYISIDDNLIRLFMSKNIRLFIKRIYNSKEDYIDSNWINKAIRKAQIKIENRNFLIRKNLLEYDNISNEQRKIIYFKRNKLLHSDNINLKIKDIIINVINLLFIDFNKSNFFLNYKKIKKILFLYFRIKINFNKIHYFSFLDFKNYIINKLVKIYVLKKKYFGKKIFFILEKNIFLRTLDLLWKEYLYSLDFLKEYIYLRSYAQKDPKQEYRMESWKIFMEMLNMFYIEILKILFSLPMDMNRLKEIFIEFDINLNILEEILYEKN